MSAHIVQSELADAKQNETSEAEQGVPLPSGSDDDFSQQTDSQPSSGESSDGISPLTTSALARSSDGSSTYNRTASDSSTATSMEAAALGALDDLTQLLRLETISDPEARRVIATFKVASVVSIALIIALGAMKSSDRGYEVFVLNRNYHASVLAATCFLLLVLSSLAYCWLDRLRMSYSAGRIWSARRKEAIRFAGSRLVVLVIILLTSVITNIAVLVDPTLLCESKWLGVFGFVRWSGYNTFLMLLCIDGHGIVLLPNAKRKDAMVRDESWTYHWPKYIFWLMIEGVLIWSLTLVAEDGHQIRITSLDGGPPVCEWGAKNQCEILAVNIISTALVVTGLCCWGLAFAFYLYTTWSQLKNRVYQQYRIVNMLLQIQLRFNAVVFAVFLVGSIVLWFTGSEACAQYTIGFFGILPLMLILTVLQCSSLYLTLPRIPSDGPPKPLALLQQFSWTESSKVKKMQRRADQLVDKCPCVLHAPMFCFETAIKSFYWAAMIYDYTEAEGHAFQNLPETIRELLGEIETAMRLFGLVRRHLFYDRVLETKVLVAWNERLVVVCARGSAEVANFVADAQFLQVAHPPKRRYQSRTPRVHAGFLRTWEANGIKERVLDHIAALIDSASDRSAVRVLFTGHSLGGAVASLAAIDTVKRCNLSSSQVAVYTFGCPRVGNHTFAQEYMEAVPDTWHIINNQDIVSHGMKLFGWYKRAGHRVIINHKGDCVVRPSLMELSLLQSIFHRSVKHHLNAEYQRALLTIITNQLRETSRQRDGLMGLLELLKAVPLVREALQTHAVNLGLNLTDALRGIGALSFRSVSMQNSGRLSKSQHMSLMRHAGVLGSLEIDEDDGEHVAVGFLDEGAGDVGDAPNMQIPQQPPATVEKVEDPASAIVKAQPNAGKSRWHHSLLSRIRSQGQQQTSSAPGGAESAGPRSGREEVVVDFTTAAGTAGRCNKKCYMIPEDDDDTEAIDGDQQQEATAEQAAPSGVLPGRSAQRKQCKLGSWRCPLTCKKEELPSNAQLHGSVVGIGAAPNMATCRLASSFAKLGLAKSQQATPSRQRGDTHACGNVLDAAGPAARPEAPPQQEALDTCPISPDIDGPLLEDEVEPDSPTAHTLPVVPVPMAARKSAANGGTSGAGSAIGGARHHVPFIHHGHRTHPPGPQSESLDGQDPAARASVSPELAAPGTPPSVPTSAMTTPDPAARTSSWRRPDDVPALDLHGLAYESSSEPSIPYRSPVRDPTLKPTSPALTDELCADAYLTARSDRSFT